jgi:hypothetical protein
MVLEGVEDGDGIVMKGGVSSRRCPDEGIVAETIGEATVVKVIFAWGVYWMEECIC